MLFDRMLKFMQEKLTKPVEKKLNEEVAKVDEDVKMVPGKIASYTATGEGTTEDEAITNLIFDLNEAARRFEFEGTDGIDIEDAQIEVDESKKNETKLIVKEK